MLESSVVNRLLVMASKGEGRRRGVAAADADCCCCCAPAAPGGRGGSPAAPAAEVAGAAEVAVGGCCCGRCGQRCIMSSTTSATWLKLTMKGSTCTDLTELPAMEERPSYLGSSKKARKRIKIQQIGRQAGRQAGK